MGDRTEARRVRNWSFGLGILFGVLARGAAKHDMPSLWYITFISLLCFGACIYAIISIWKIDLAAAKRQSRRTPPGHPERVDTLGNQLDPAFQQIIARLRPPAHDEDPS